MNVNIKEALFVIENVRHLTESTYVVRFSRNGMEFVPGQHLLLGITGSTELREYSIYNGIAPFHSFVRSFPQSDYRLIQGVRFPREAYELADYERDRVTICTSGDNGGDYHGRLTDFLLETDLDPGRAVYLCGNSQMIFDAMDILRARGIPQNRIFTEVYF